MPFGPKPRWLNLLTIPPIVNIPPSISGLQLWLKGEIIALNDGDTISIWNDSSLLSNNATQSIGANKPICKIINGKFCARFDGSNDFLQIASNSGLSFSSTGSLFAVINPSVISGITITSKGNNAGDPDHIWNIGAFLNGSMNLYNGSAWNQSGIASIIIASIQIVELIWTGTAINFFVNGIAKGSPATTTVWQTSTEPFFIGNQGSVPTNPFNGDIYELIGYNNSVSPANRSIIEHYLGDKYGIAVP